MIVESPDVPLDVFERVTGWVIKPEGACRGGICVPLEKADPPVDLLTERLGMGAVHDDRHGLWAIGPSTVGGRALESAEAPDFTLPDLDGRPFEFASLRGRKVVLVAWASW
jgi:hypothetical protein